MRKRLQYRWEHLPAMAFARARSAFEPGVPVTGDVCQARVTLPLFRARAAVESSP